MLQRILNLVFWLGVLLVGAAFGIRFGYPAWEQYATYLAWAGLAAVVLYTLGQWREIGGMFGRRQARYGTLAGTSVLVVLGIIVAVNYIGVRQNKRWDLTANQTFTLSDQSRNTVATLDAPLAIQVFVQENEFQNYRDRLQQYEYVSKNISTEYIDPDKRPAIARQNQIQQYGTIVLSYKSRTERVTSNTEQDITNAIIKVVTGQQKKVYFTEGHGERDIEGSDQSGYNTVATGLKNENYGAEKLVLAQRGSVPDDAAVVIVAGPKTDFFPAEIDALKTYLDKAGKLLLAIDPPEKADSPAPTNLIALARDWGAEVGTNVVVDASGMGRLLGTDASVPVAADYPAHAITERFDFLTAFPLARSVTPVEGGVNGRTAQAVVNTSERSWAESDIRALLTTGRVALETARGDKQGPITIAVAVTAAAATPPASTAEATLDPDTPKPETRVVISGDSDFATNQGLTMQGNRDLFMNIVGWLSQQENLISIRPKEPEDRRLTMTALQLNNVTWLSWIIIPAAIFGGGVYTWWRRR